MSDWRTATSAPSARLWPMPPDAAMRSPATLRSLTCHIGSRERREARRERIVLVGTRRRAREPSATAYTSICSDPCDGSLAARRRRPALPEFAGRCATARCALWRPPRTAMRGSRRRSALRLGETAGRTFSRIAMRCWLIGAAGPWSVASAWRSACDRALERLGQRRRVEVAQHRARIVARAAHEPASCRRCRRRSPPAIAARRRAASRRLHARSCEIAQSSSVGDRLPVLSWWIEQHVDVLLLDVQCVALGPAPPSAAGTRSTPSSHRAQVRAGAAPSTSPGSSARSGTRAAWHPCRNSGRAARRAAATSASSADCRLRAAPAPATLW